MFTTLDIAAEFERFADKLNTAGPTRAETDFERVLYAAYLVGFAHAVQGFSDNVAAAARESVKDVRAVMADHLLVVLANDRAGTAAAMGFTACEAGDCAAHDADPTTWCAACRNPLCPHCERSLLVTSDTCPMNHAALLREHRQSDAPFHAVLVQEKQAPVRGTLDWWKW